MINLFFVEAPFQLISANEVARGTKTGKNILILRKTGLIRNDLQIKKLLTHSILKVWDEVIFLNSANYFYLACRFIFLKMKFLLLNKKINVIGLGDYRGRVSLFFYKVFRCDELWFLDDGIATLNLFKFDGNTLTTSLEGDNRTRLSSYFFGFLNRRVKKIALKTFLDLKASTPFEVSSVDLTAAFTRERATSQIVDSGKIFFLGAKLIKSKFLSASDYYGICRRISIVYSGREIIYLPHRDECIDSVNEICTMFNFKKLVPELPIEFYLCESKELPGEVVSVCSAALCTIPKIFPQMKVSIIDFDRSHMVLREQESFEVCYKYILSSGLVGLIQ